MRIIPFLYDLIFMYDIVYVARNVDFNDNSGVGEYVFSRL